MNHHPVESYNDWICENIFDTDYWRNWNGDYDKPSNSKDYFGAKNESVLGKVNGIEDLQCPAQQDVSTTANNPRLIRPTWRSERPTDKVLVTVKAMDMWWNMGIKKL
jgi:hypothetical protein